MTTNAKLPHRERLTQEYLKSILDYDPITGVFTWKVSRPSAGGRTVIGAEAGFIRTTDGYRFIGIDGNAYMACKLAWLFMHGVYPMHTVDHENRERGDDRFLNLRKATRTQNAQNKSVRSDNNSGVTGVSFDKARGRWASRIKFGGKYIALGRFRDIEDAIRARSEAELKYFGEFSPVAA